MTTVNIYLTFNGNCKQAFDFYKSIFGGEYPYVGTFGEMPPQEGMPPIPEEMKAKIMHISLPISKETMLMGSDSGGEWAKKLKQGNNFSVSVNVDNTEEADRIFNALSEGGNITMPLAKTFWESYFGMLTDKFGINWMVSCELSTHKTFEKENK
ncbi:VOC family protein [Mangrovimonas spongiae]|uniref:VOC family protein n=1 Tax=Mangrovimonas spongiae TaxID=2494697 RepID=A0A428JVM2_9FLAO|nr:VOC family protein [Mangrovimonas spongiae]RSK38261.1 VOC family protein [Mangrovimonas spongiae]